MIFNLSPKWGLFYVQKVRSATRNRGDQVGHKRSIFIKYQATFAFC